MNQTAARIFVRSEFVGFHSWPDAPAHRAYLASGHRHRFQVEAQTLVLHDDREVEFHDVIEELGHIWEKEIGRPGSDKGSMSCEMMAREFGSALSMRWPRAWTVSVSEDGECGATVEVRP